MSYLNPTPVAPSPLAGRGQPAAGGRRRGKSSAYQIVTDSR